MSQSPWAIPPHQSLVIDTKSTWQTTEKSIDIEQHKTSNRTFEATRHTMFHLTKFFRVASFLLLLLFLGTLAVYTPYYRPHMEEKPLTKTMMGTVVGEHTIHAQPDIMDLVLVQTLDQSLVPTSGKHRDRNSRLVIVGDVHGMKNELVRLLDKVEFDKKTDHLILAGDMISKGPDSKGVLDLIMKLGATAVRGNHEDRILLAYHRLQSQQGKLGAAAVEKHAAKRDEKLSEMKVSKKGE